MIDNIDTNLNLQPRIARFYAICSIIIYFGVSEYAKHQSWSYPYLPLDIVWCIIMCKPSVVNNI
jgi:hypothetical protein